MKEIIKDNLSFVFYEMETQLDVARYYPSNGLSYEDHMAQIREFIVDAEEYGLAYEYTSGALENLPFRVSGQAAVKLLEAGGLMGFK
ncbi:MAG: hypothetical protein LBU45_01295 [Azoarcus sp.]|jgi:hypothetical protein|nr:hypothetical protein [Azoarcus sp.]